LLDPNVDRARLLRERRREETEEEYCCDRYQSRWAVRHVEPSCWGGPCRRGTTGRSARLAIRSRRTSRVSDRRYAAYAGGSPIPLHLRLLPQVLGAGGNGSPVTRASGQESVRKC